MGTVWAMKALSVAGPEVQSSQSLTFHSLLPFLSFFFPFLLSFYLTRSLSPDAAGLVLIPGFTFQHCLSWETSSSGQGAMQIKTGLWLALPGLLRFPMCPCAPSTSSLEGKAGKCYTPPFTRSLCERSTCNGLGLDSPPSSSLLVSSGLNSSLDIKKGPSYPLLSPFPIPNTNSRWLLWTSQPQSERKEQWKAKCFSTCADAVL